MRFFRERLLNQINPVVFSSQDLIARLGITQNQAESLITGATGGPDGQLTEQELFEELKKEQVFSFDPIEDTFSNKGLLTKVDELDGQANIQFNNGNIIWNSVGAQTPSTPVAPPPLDLTKMAQEALGNIQKIKDDNELTGRDRTQMISQIQDQIRNKIREYVFSPLDSVDFANLDPEEEKKLIESLFERANEAGDQIVKSMVLDETGNDPLQNLRSGLLYDLTEDIEYTVNTTLEDLPSFEGENDNEVILAEKFGIVRNITNDDFIDIGITYDQLKDGGPFSAPRDIEVYNPYIKISGTSPVSEDIQKELSRLFPDVDPKYFERIYITDDPSMTFRGANIPTNKGAGIPVINPENIAARAEDSNTDHDITTGRIIANELAHSAFFHMFPSLDPYGSCFGDYSDPNYRMMNNHQFNELISDAASAQFDPSQAITEALKTDEDRYKFTKAATVTYLESRGFTPQEIEQIELAAPENRQQTLSELTERKNLQIDDLNRGFQKYMYDLMQDLMGYAKLQTAESP